MGYYIETPQNRGKAEYIIGAHGAREVSIDEAEDAVKNGEGVVCVVNNGAWEAAGFVYSLHEFQAFDPRFPNSNDSRPRKWLVMDLAKAKELSGYRH